MSTTRPFAINDGSTISGTTQVGRLVIGVDDQDYSQNPGGVTWYMGPDEELGFVVAMPSVSGTTLEFKRTPDLTPTDEEYLTIVNHFAVRRGLSGFTSPIDASSWVGLSGYTNLQYNSYYQSLYDTWTNKPSGVVGGGLNTLFGKLSGNNNLEVDYLTDKFDSAYLFGIHTNNNGESLKNIVNPGTYDATLVNTPVFNQFSGFKGDAVSKYIRLNWNTNDDGVKFTQNDAHHFIYSLDKNLTGSYWNGSYSNPPLSYNTTRFNGVSFYGALNSESTSYVPFNRSTTLYGMSRDNSDNVNIFRNGSYINLAKASTTGLTVFDSYTHCVNANGSPAYHGAERIAFESYGSSLTQTEAQELESILDWWFNFDWLNLSDELFVNGNFATDSFSGWTVVSEAADFYVTGGTVVRETSAYFRWVEQDVLEIGSWYLFEYDLVEKTAGNLRVEYGTTLILPASIGTQRLIIQAGQTNFKFVTYSSTACKFDNLSIKKIIGLT